MSKLRFQWNGGRLTAFDKKFWRYSSRNIIGQTPHPRTKHIRERVLNLWAALNTLQDISDELDLSQDTVHSYIKRARRRGDPRAITRKRHWRRRQAKADQRREQILLMSKAGMETKRIAAIMRITERLVQYRLKEAENGDKL
jgi:DNA-binding CsgD family transcriptional regulator